jgi:adenine-specific DNA-methyltransferase
MSKKAPASAKSAATQADILSYRHPDRRKNNPEVGMVTPTTDPFDAKTRWAHDPHLDPTLSWTGKTERTRFAVDTVSLHVHERIDPASILSAARKKSALATAKSAAKDKAKGAKAAQQRAMQPGLFDAPFESLPLRDAIDFYKHDKGWSNRLVAGDSLLVMNSLLQKEGMAGQVQAIYFDPPYGIKYGSNFQPFVNKRDVKDRKDEDLTQEPEMIKAFRDTWELGIHSYLTYLRDRLLLAKELLSESGSVFVQISDENLHHVREIMDEVFGAGNFGSQITVQKTPAKSGSTLIGATCDYLFGTQEQRQKVSKYREKIWWARCGQYEALNADSAAPRLSGRHFLMGVALSIHGSHNLFAASSRGDVTEFFWMGRFSILVRLHGKQREPGLRLIKAGRVTGTGMASCVPAFQDDFPVGPVQTNLGVTLVARAEPFLTRKVYVVQTSALSHSNAAS